MQRTMKTNRTLKSISPWTIILLIVLALIIFIPAISEYVSVKKDMVDLWRQQGELLSETILRSADKIAAFDEQARMMDRRRLEDMAFYIRQLDSLNYPNTRLVRRYARMHARLLVLVFDEKEKLVTQPHNRRFDADLRRLKYLLHQIPEDRLVWPIPEDFFGPQKRNGYIVRRSNHKGFLVLLTHPLLHPPDIRAGSSRRHLSTWMGHLTERPSIRYIFLLRHNDVLAQNGPVPQLPVNFPIEPGWKIRELKDQSVFEFVRGTPGKLQVIIGFASTALDRLQNNLIRRLIVNSIILLLLGSILIIYLIRKEHYAFLKTRYARISAYNASILEHMEEGLLLMEDDFTLSVINPAAARIFSLPDPATEPVSINALYPLLSKEILNRLQAFENIDGLTIEIPGGKQLIQLNAKPVEFDPGDAKRSKRRIYIIIVRDVTAQTELEHMRSRRSKLTAMGELASRVAHEIRNPLNGISVLAQRIQREFRPDTEGEEFEKMTASIRDESNRINEIIEAFLRYARTPELKMTPIDLTAWLQENAPVFQSAGNVQLAEWPAVPCPVLADTDQLKQALLNLVKNAVEATADPKPVTIRLNCSEYEASIQVEDLGPGIGEEERERIFDLYFSTKTNGSGLGLSIVEKIVSAHNGHVKLTSPYQSDGSSGTRVEIILPKQNG